MNQVSSKPGEPLVRAPDGKIHIYHRFRIKHTNAKHEGQIYVPGGPLPTAVLLQCTSYAATLLASVAVLEAIEAPEVDAFLDFVQ